MPGQVVPDNRHRDVEIAPLTAELRTPFVASGVSYQIRVYAANAGAVVHQIQNLTADFYDVPRQANGANMQFDANSPSDVFDFSFDFVDSYSAQHYNMADTVLLGFNYANTHRDPNETDPLRPGARSA
jgi:hypothetical protein